MKKRQKDDSYQIHSPNDWFNRANLFVDTKGSMCMPFPALTIALGAASEAIEEYKAAGKLMWSDQEKLISRAAMKLREADSLYFSHWANKIRQALISAVGQESIPCRNCFESSFSEKALREATVPQLVQIRDMINADIIHAAENGKIILAQQFELVERYYESIISLDLVEGPTASISVKQCKTCRNVKKQQ